VSFDRAGVAAHATQLASAIQGNLKRSLEALGVVSSGQAYVLTVCSGLCQTAAPAGV
jgi:hypothetical protein